MFVGGLMVTLATITLLLSGLWTRWRRWLSPPRILAVVKVTERKETEQMQTECIAHIGNKTRVRGDRKQPENVSYFVRYQLDAREFYWWPTRDRPDFYLPDSSVTPRTSKIARAKLTTQDGMASTDVTSQVRALAGPNGDFHGKCLDPAVLRRFFGMLVKERPPKTCLSIASPVHLPRKTLRVVYLPRFNVVDTPLC